MVLSSYSVQAGNCLSGNIKPYSLYFVNGVGNDWESAQTSVGALKDLIGMENQIEYKDWFQPSEYRQNALFSEAYEVLRQKYGDYESNPNFKAVWSVFMRWHFGVPNKLNASLVPVFEEIRARKMREEWVADVDLRRLTKSINRDLYSGQKVILVAHSQGNFYANLAWEYFNQKNNGTSERIGIISVANPAARVADGGPHTTLHEDKVMSSVRKLFPSTTIASNFRGGNVGEFSGHKFVKTYLKFGSLIREEILSNILEVMGKLKECANLCSLGEGQVFDIYSPYSAIHSLGDVPGMVQVRFSDPVELTHKLFNFSIETTRTSPKSTLFSVSTPEGNNLHEGSFYWDPSSLGTHMVRAKLFAQADVSSQYELTCPGKEFTTPSPPSIPHKRPATACEAERLSGYSNKAYSKNIELGSKAGKVEMAFNDGSATVILKVKSVGSGKTLLTHNESGASHVGDFYFDSQQHNNNTKVVVTTNKASIAKVPWEMELSCPGGSVSEIVAPEINSTVSFNFGSPRAQASCSFDLYINGVMRRSFPNKAPHYSYTVALPLGRHSYSLDKFSCNYSYPGSEPWQQTYTDSSETKILKNGSFTVQ